MVFFLQHLQIANVGEKQHDHANRPFSATLLFLCVHANSVADQGEGPGGGGGWAPPYIFENSAFSVNCQNYLHRIQHS